MSEINIDLAAFNDNLAAAFASGDMDTLRGLLHNIFDGLDAETSPRLEAELIAVAARQRHLSTSQLAYLYTAFNWDRSGNPARKYVPEAYDRMMKRVAAARFYTGLESGIDVTARRPRLHTRLRKAARVVVEKGEPENGLKSIPWTPLAYEGWLKTISAMAPESFDYFDRIRINWLHVRRDVIGDLSFARSVLIIGLLIPLVTQGMMALYKAKWFLPDYDMPLSMALAGIVATIVPLYAFLSRVLPR